MPPIVPVWARRMGSRVLAGAVLLAGTSLGADDAAKARKKLDDEYIPFTGEEFLSRVSRNDKKVVDLFLQAGIAVDSADRDGRTALHAAARQEDGKLLAALLKARANPNAADKKGTTPLCIAAEEGVLGNVTALVQAKADATPACGIDKRTALHEAAREGKVPVVQALIAAGAPLNARDGSQETPLHHAAQEISGGALRILLAAGADVNVKARSGDTPLHEANNSRYGANAKPLLAAGAEVDARNFRGETALFEAARNDSVELATILLQAGADPAARDTGGTTPLEVAKRVGALRTTELLKDAKRVPAPPRPSTAAASAVAAGAAAGDPKQEMARLGLTLDEKTFFDRVEAGDGRALALFLKAGFPPGTRNQHGRTALHLVVERGLGDAARALLASGADPNDGGHEKRRIGGILIENDDTPLMAAAERGQAEIVQALLDAKALVDKTDKDGQTALARTANLGKADMVELLVKAGANVNAVTKDGTPVLMGPAALGFTDVVRALLKAGAKVGKQRAALLGAAGSHADIKKMLQTAP